MSSWSTNRRKAASGSSISLTCAIKGMVLRGFGGGFRASLGRWWVDLGAFWFDGGFKYD